MRRKTAAASTEPRRNIGELGATIDGTLGTTHIHTTQYNNIAKGDGILVVAMAPALPSGGAPEGYAASVTDSVGNVYDLIQVLHYDQNPTVVNRGTIVAIYYAENSVAAMPASFGFITAEWDNPVYDRIISAWQIRPGDTAGQPFVLAHTAEHSAGIYAATQVTLTAPDYTPSRDFGQEFALIITSKPGGTGGFGAVVGYNGFFQPLSRSLTGSKQTYFMNPQFHDADVYTVAGAVPAIYYFTLGVWPGGATDPSFNGVGQNFTLGANADKGIILFGKA